MDKNSAIGFTLIAAILLSYYLWFSPSTPPQTAQEKKPETSGQTVPGKIETPTVPDSVLTQTYGELASAFKGQEQATIVETPDLKVTFSSKGGVIKDVELARYKTYSQKPLKLITPANNEFSLNARYGGKDIDLYTLYYTLQQQKNADTTVVTYTTSLGNGSSIAHIYSIPDKGYEIGYRIETKGQDQFGAEPLRFQWNNTIELVEKDIAEMRKNTTITYYLPGEDDFDHLSETSNGIEAEPLTVPVKWVSIKEKFFLASFISTGKDFTSGEVQTELNPNDTSYVKKARIKLVIPKETLAAGQSDFKFYFGPNDYQEIGSVTEQFKKNVYLGWPPVYWINKFVIFPVFHFLTKFIGNYGLIIIILVILLKLVLFPLSYKSYLSMAKMKVLKPELDEIKERVGDDMTKVQQEQMKLYQQVGVNPISGCIPVLLQMPILFAMFYLFPASIELRQQPFLWAEDLSTYDSIINFGVALPFLGSHISLFTVIMTATTLLYTWQNNQISSVTGPMKVMSYVMPLIFFFVLNSFSAGLTFYYTVSTLVTFGQQAIIKRFVDEDKIRALMEENRKKIAAGGGGKKSKFMSKLEEAMKASEETKRRLEEEKRKKK
jgi:YidC/Oxa1 family membrane protein insertase